jgi:basic membrane protein A
MKNSLRTIFLTFAIMAIAAGCNTPDEVAHEATNFSVALLTPGPVNDTGWNEAAFDGMELIKAKLGAKTATLQTTAPTDIEPALRDFAKRGVNLIFAHGFEYGNAALQVAKLYPKTIFIVTSGTVSAANVESLDFKEEEAAYVEGVLAGGMSRSGVVGAVGGIPLPAIKLAFEGFRRGFVSVQPKGRVLESYTGDFDNVSDAKEAAIAQVEEGADLLMHNADAAGLGVFQAASQAHVYAFGANRNQNSVAQEVVLASAVTEIAKAFLQIATQVKNGSFHPDTIVLGMKDGMVKVVYNDRLKDRIPAAVRARADAAEQEIIAGKIRFPPQPEVQQ